MRRSALPILIVACVVVAAVLAWLALQRHFPRAAPSEASGPVTTEIRTPGEFEKVDVSGHFDIELVQGPKHEVTVEAAPDMLDRIRTRVTGSKLSISIERSGWRPFQGASRMPRVVVTAPNFDAISAAGTVRVKASGLDVPSLRIAGAGATTLQFDKLKTDELRVAGSGALKASFAGQARELTVSLSGAGSVNAADLKSEDGKVSVAGAGHVVINASSTLRVSLSGAGKVEYYGDPELQKSVSGMGSIKRRDGTPVQGPERPVRFLIA